MHILTSILDQLATLGPWAFIPLYVLGTLLLVPDPLMVMAGGAVFGIWSGFALVSAAAILSATGVFWAGRLLSRKWVSQKIARNPKIKALDDMATHGGWKMVVLLRQTFIIPFSIMNYALGLSKIPFKNYFLASWFGMMPAQFLYAYLGAITGKLALEGRSGHKTIAEWVLVAVGFLVTVVLSVRATRIVQRSL